MIRENISRIGVLIMKKKSERTRRSSNEAYGRTYERTRRDSSEVQEKDAGSFFKKTMMRLCVCAVIFALAVVLKNSTQPAMADLRETISDTMGAVTTAQDVEVFAQNVSSKIGEITGTTVTVFSEDTDSISSDNEEIESTSDEPSSDENAEDDELSLSDYAVNVSMQTPMEIVEPLDDFSLFGAATESYDCDTSEARVDLPSNVCNDNLILPIELRVPVDRHVTSKFGTRINPVTHKESFHYGIDIGAPEGYPIVAPADGTVADVSYSSSYGEKLTIHHDYGIGTFYGHCSEILVDEGEFVEKGQVVARVGSTGWSTGPHLHFELHKDMMILNPENYFELIYD